LQVTRNKFMDSLKVNLNEAASEVTNTYTFNI
jgi:hypothetical protein